MGKKDEMLPPIIDQDELTATVGNNARKAVIECLSLSDSNKARVKRYYELAIQPRISDLDAAQIEVIWKSAIDDDELAEALGLIDDMHPPCLAGEDLLADNRDYRVHISDCLPLLAEEKLKRQKGELEEFETEEDCDSDTVAKTLLCPDGSGAFNVRVPKSSLFGIKPDEKCPHCQHRLGDHTQIDVNSKLSHVCG